MMPRAIIHQPNRRLADWLREHLFEVALFSVVIAVATIASVFILWRCTRAHLVIEYTDTGKLSWCAIVDVDNVEKGYVYENNSRWKLDPGTETRALRNLSDHHPLSYWEKRLQFDSAVCRRVPR